MGGEGKRFEDPIPKQFHRLSGKKVYLHTLETFLKMNIFDEIILSCHPQWVEEVTKETKSFSNIKVINGGKSRQESSYLALLSSPCHFVVIHDAVRPFIGPEVILENVKTVIEFDAVDTCIKSVDTIVRSNEMHEISDIPRRDLVWRGQTPQSFKYSLILNAHKNTKNINASDDCQLVLELGKKIKIVEGREDNIKITTSLDLFLAEQILRMKPTTLSKTEISLKGKIYAIVGGSGGIGSKICQALAKEGAIVIPLSKSSRLPLDLTDENSIKNAFSKIFQKFGEIDGLINSAGVLNVAPLHKLTLNDIKSTIDVNLTGLILGCRLAKIKKDGSIVNIASSSFARGRPNFATYSATKAAVVNFTQGLAEELFPLKVNVVVPQRTNTPMRRRNFPNENENDLLPPESIAKVVCDLLKDHLTTGAILEVKNLE